MKISWAVKNIKKEKLDKYCFVLTVLAKIFRLRILEHEEYLRVLNDGELENILLYVGSKDKKMRSEISETGENE